MAAQVESQVTIKLLDDGTIRVELEQAPHLRLDDTLRIVAMAVRNCLDGKAGRTAGMSNGRFTSLWLVDWPDILDWPG